MRESVRFVACNDDLSPYGSIKCVLSYHDDATVFLFSSFFFSSSFLMMLYNVC